MRTARYSIYECCTHTFGSPRSDVLEGATRLARATGDNRASPTAATAGVEAATMQPMKPQNPHSGALIVVEGIDGSGSTTQSDMLLRWLLRVDIPAMFT